MSLSNWSGAWSLTRNMSCSRSDWTSTVFGVNCDSGATNETVAGKTYSGAASTTTRASPPILSRPACGPGRYMVVYTSERSITVAILPPGGSTAPGSTSRYCTRPRTGDLIVESSIVACSSSTLASAVLTEAWASSTCDFAALRAASALLSCCVRWSYVSRVDQPLSTSVAVRRICSFAKLSWASSLATSARRVATVWRASAAEACAWCSCAMVWFVSMRATTSPGETISPSCGTISTTRPEILVEMSTWVASTRPLTLTMPAGNNEAWYWRQK